ncbi:MAG: hypothetical protein QOI84_1459 [Solirubrobacterales bacterium]|jgi:hypothetical protein|nr:hypothetical protein [Solirubrobacterales bacterium]
MKNATKLFGVVVVLVAALALSACGSSGGNGSTATQNAQAGPVPTIVIENGEPVGGIKQLEYSAGERIQFKVESDIAEEVHFHGYEVMKDVKAGGTVSFDMPAEIEGIFEVELEGKKEQIAEITVNP